MPGFAAVFAGVCVMAIMRLIYWMVLELTGDTRQVSFSFRNWLAFVAAGTVILALNESIGEPDRMPQVVLLDVLICAVISLAAAVVLFFLQRKQSPFWLSLVSCELARRVVALVMWAMSGEP